VAKVTGSSLAGLCAIALLAGCDARPKGPALMPVGGTVTLDGRPAPGIILSFIPVGRTHGASAGDRTNGEGRYELVNAHGGKGTPVGRYKVVAVKFRMPDGSDLPANMDLRPDDVRAKQVFPSKYSDSDQTVLTATVHDGANTIDFALSSTPSKR
jgi:hypothetical protein